VAKWRKSLFQILWLFALANTREKKIPNGIIRKEMQQPFIYVGCVLAAGGYLYCNVVCFYFILFYFILFILVRAVVVCM
jgi:hypothetical protein